MTKFLTRFKEEQEGGFTLIELLVVILIIGILTAIATPAFLNQRKGAVDSTVKTDLTNAGTVLTTEALAGKTLNSTVTITSNGPLTASGEVELFQRVANTGAMDTSGIKVSEGTTIILQPSSVDGGICMFAVNPAGDISAKSPGFVYDSLAGGRLNEGSTPVACADDADQLAVPEAQIEQALGGQTETPSDTPSDTPLEGEVTNNGNWDNPVRASLMSEDMEMPEYPIESKWRVVGDRIEANLTFIDITGPNADFMADNLANSKITASWYSYTEAGEYVYGDAEKSEYAPTENMTFILLPSDDPSVKLSELKNISVSYTLSSPDGERHN